MFVHLQAQTIPNLLQYSSQHRQLPLGSFPNLLAFGVCAGVSLDLEVGVSDIARFLRRHSATICCLEFAPGILL